MSEGGKQTPESLCSLLRRFPRLQTLSMEMIDAPVSRAAIVRDALQGRASQLTELTLWNYKENECGALLPLLTNLRTLGFSLLGAEFPDFGGISYPHLRELNLGDCDVSVDKFAAVLLSMPALAQILFIWRTGDMDELLRVMLLAHKRGVQRLIVHPREALDLAKKHQSELGWIEVIW